MSGKWRVKLIVTLPFVREDVGERPVQFVGGQLAEGAHVLPGVSQAQLHRLLRARALAETHKLTSGWPYMLNLRHYM